MIPDFDHNYVLPPHLGDATDSVAISPYRGTILEFAEKLVGSTERRKIATGLLQFRKRLVEAGAKGYQWVGGSFVEDIEKTQFRPPNDMDVVTFLDDLTPQSIQKIIRLFPELLNATVIYENYHVHNFIVRLDWDGQTIVEETHYRSQLFSHTRNRLWKGMLRLELGTLAEDANALQFLNKLA